MISFYAPTGSKQPPGKSEQETKKPKKAGEKKDEGKLRG
jgi:hypothetical protein